MTPGDRLRAARLNAGFRSVAKASATLGMSESSYRAHENGQNQFTPAQAQRYASIFGCDPLWLLHGPYQDDDGEGAAEMVAAVTLSNSAILAALVQALTRKGLLTDDEMVEVYESALLLMETQQAEADDVPGLGRVTDMARELIEQHLRPEGK